MPRISKIEMDRWLVSGSWKDLKKRAAGIINGIGRFWKITRKSAGT